MKLEIDQWVSPPFVQFEVKMINLPVVVIFQVDQFVCADPNIRVVELSSD